MIKFGTKAETLKLIEKKIKGAKIMPQITFSVSEWRERKEDFWPVILESFGDMALVVRSSAIEEDSAEESHAGEYESVLEVRGQSAFEKATETVITSYGKAGRDNNQILVQPMLQHVEMSGVAFTLDPVTLGNYYVINYDDTTGATNTVTSGNGKKNKLFYAWKGKKGREQCKQDWRLDKLAGTLYELEQMFESDSLDVEFAFAKDEELYILQVRPLCVEGHRIRPEVQEITLEAISKKVASENTTKPFLFGRRTIYGVMPDWNPAEIIGIRPKNLALSLYKEIITDSTWAYQRNNYGYKNLRSFPLMQDFCGLPYIDVRVSFNSFIPAALDESISEKLVDYYLDRLQERPDLHDKIEFEIVFSCYTLDLEERIQILYKHGFSDEEIRQIIDALREMTCKIIDNEEGLWKKDYKKIETLAQRFEIIQNSNMDRISKIYWLLEDCKRYGTLPFAGLARAGFIAVQLLKSMIAKEIITEEEYQLFMSGLKTISYTMKKDFTELSKTAFLKKYGHLRPGTYDITSKRYDEASDIYFDWNKQQHSETEKNEFKLSLIQMECLKKLLKENGLPEEILDVFNFIRTAIEGREFAKFVFTKNLSQALVLFAEIGKEHGYSEEECAYADIQIIYELFSSVAEEEDLYRKSIKNGQEKYGITRYLTLPPLIFDSSDVYAFSFPENQPNYITLEKVTGNLAVLKDNAGKMKLEDKIVLIPSADPGYDWIFSQNIKGFITTYGGANSHMAIRANELQIPAVIGIGEALYQQLLKADMVEIDAQSKKVNIFK